MEWRMEMKTMERRRRLPLSRRPKDGDAPQEKPRRQLHLQRVKRMKKMNFHQRSPKERAEAGPLARRPKKKKSLKMRRKRRKMKLQPRNPMVGDVQQAKPRRQQCTRRTVKKVRMEAIQSLRWSKMRTVRTTLIQKLLQQRKQRSLRPKRRSL